MHVRHGKLSAPRPAPGVSVDVSPVTSPRRKSPTGPEEHSRGPVRPVPVMARRRGARPVNVGPVRHGPHAQKYLALGSDWTPMDSPRFPMTGETVFLPETSRTPVSCGIGSRPFGTACHPFPSHVAPLNTPALRFRKAVP